MADENDAGAAYLAALRQSTAHQSTGAAPTRAQEIPRSAPTQTESAASPARTNQGSADARKSPRYKCNGSARIQEAGSTGATWATFSDISIHGCYVETAAPLRLGAVLGLKLDANGFRVEVTGEVRVVYPSLGMGISFVRMSDEDRQRLRELVRLISPPSVIVSSRNAQPAPSATRLEVSPEVANPAAALQAIVKFFEQRHVMGREEFLTILRKSR